MICFVLVGALVLRVISQQNLINTFASVCLGLVYCVFLIIAPLLSRVPFLFRYQKVVSWCGVFLAPLIILESFHYYHILEAHFATLSMFVIGSVAVVVGTTKKQSSFATTALLLSLLAIAGLGLTLEALLLRCSVIVVFSITAFTVASFRNWPALRSLILLFSALGIGFAALVTGSREGIPVEISLSMKLMVVVFWLIVSANHVVRSKNVTSTEAAWLSVISGWAAGILFIISRSQAVVFTPVVAIILLAAGGLLAVYSRSRIIAARGFLASGCVLALISFPQIDFSGVGLGLFAILLSISAQRIKDPVVMVFSSIMFIITSVIAIKQQNLFSGTDTTHSLALVGTLMLAFMLIAHSWVAGGRQWKGSSIVIGRYLAPVSFFAGLLVGFGVIIKFLVIVLGFGLVLSFSITMTAAIFAIFTLLAGKKFGYTGIYAAGITATVLLAIKVVFWDMFQLKDGYLLAAFVVLGGVFIVISVTLKQSDAGSQNNIEKS